jgi:hypothetical protein
MIRRVERCLQRFPLRFFTLIDRDVLFILPILGMNLQAYASNPVSWVDPLGWCADPKKTKLAKSDHAKLRSTQGRSTSQAHSDLQNARDSDIFVQEDGRFVVLKEEST